MDYFLPSSVKSRLLRFALARTGFLDTDALDLDKLNFNLGRNSNAEFRDVGLRLEKLTALLQLPPSIRLLAARALLVRVSITTDLSITAEVEGIQLRAVIEDVDLQKQDEKKVHSVKTPRHRKTARRIPPTSTHDPGGRPSYNDDDDNNDTDDTDDNDNEAHIPTVQDVAASFLDVEPAEEKQELEAALLSQSKSIESSVLSDASDENAVGMGNALGLPGFLAGFITGVLDRLRVTIKNVELTCEATLPPPSPGDSPIPVSIALNIGSIDIDAVTSLDRSSSSQTRDRGTRLGSRRIALANTSVDMICKPSKSSETSRVSPPRSPGLARAQSPTPPRPASERSGSSLDLSGSTSSYNSPIAVQTTTSARFYESVSTTPTFEQEPVPFQPSSEALTASVASTTNTSKGRFADADEDDDASSGSSAAASEIRAGEDSHSYTSRRSQSSSDQEQTMYAPAEDYQNLTESIAEFQNSESDLADALPNSFTTSETPVGDALENAAMHVEDLHLDDSTPDTADAAGSTPTVPSSPISNPDLDDPMTQSVMYSQELGESMYLSAISEGYPSPPNYRRTPGHFPDESELEALSQSTSTIQMSDKATEFANKENLSISPGLTEHGREHDAGASAGGLGSAPATPQIPQHDVDRVRKRLLSLNTLTLWLPGKGPSAGQDDVDAQSVSFNTAPQNSVTASMYARNMPGTFSAYAEMGASRRLQASYTQDQSSILEPEAQNASGDSSLDIDLGILNIQADLSTVRSIWDMAVLVRLGDSDSVPRTSKPLKKSNPSSDQLPLPKLSMRLQRLNLGLLEQLEQVSEPGIHESFAMGFDQSRAVISACARDVTFGLVPQAMAPDITFAIRRFTAGTNAKQFLSFTKPTHSHNGTAGSPDVLLKIQRSKVTLQNRSIIDVRAWLRPIHVDLDLLAIDQALSSFGGLSGVMELSASALSSDPDQSTVSPSSQRRGVRFEEDVKPVADEAETSELKLNISIQGVGVALKSHSCSPDLQFSALKINVRPNYVLLTVGNVRLQEGPTHDKPSPARFNTHLKDIKLEYLTSPEDSDLERLLSLLTPSKNKYENDDDILLDTLIRQRRKGAVLRIKVSSVQVGVKCWSFLKDIQMLGDDLSKFAVVTKYLPEDDRPGLLILPRIADLNARLPVTDKFGMLEISCKDLQVAHIGLPALVALSIGGVRAGPQGSVDIVHEIRPIEQLPMVMMRMVGDEVEPTVKIKLFNVCIEYSVATIIALTESDTPADPNEIVDNIATSILDLATIHIENQPPSAIIQSQGGTRPPKKIGLDVLLHDCALGLKPSDSDAKGMLVLANTKFSTVVPPGDVFSATLELRQASLHIINQEKDTKGTGLAPRPTPISDRLPSYLSAQGYVSVSSIMSAKAVVSVAESKDEKARSVDIEVRDELIVLETCADSMQTLVSLFNGLAPPSPPNDEPKFRTEVMTLDDMITSFTGDSFEKPQEETSTIFDAEETSPPLEVHDSLADSANTDDSLGYNERSSGTDDDNDAAIFDDSHYDAKTIESFIEEEGFYEITDTTTPRPLGNDALWDHIQMQSVQQTRGNPTELSRFHFADQQIDKAHSTILGASHSFDTPGKVSRNDKLPRKNDQAPFRIRVRDVHIIWNLYDGYDWDETRNAIAEAVEEVEQRLEERKQRRRRSHETEEEEDSIIGDCLFNSIYIGVPANRDPADLRREISRGIDDLASESESYATSGTSRPTHYSAGRSGRQLPKTRRLRLARSKAHKIAFELKGVSLDFSLHAPGSGEVQSSMDVRLRDFEIFDNVPTSTWRKFLTYFHDEENMREMMKPMIHIEMLNIRPVPDLAATELSLRVSVLPLRLHVDQDALDFITRFFEFRPNSAQSTPPSDPPFIQRIEVNTVTLCLDYKPKKVDYGGIRSGHTGEFKNFVILDRANMKLKHVIVYGVKGFDALHPTLSDIWTPDVIRNQLPGVLAGLAPLRPLVSLGVGIRDVVGIPVREYRKDGRLVRSVQKGAFNFAKTTTAELARLGAKIAVGTQTVLSGVEETLGRNQQHIEDEHDPDERRLVSNYADQPLGVLQGLRSARRQLERDLLTARDAFIAVQGEVVDAGSATGAAQAFARHAPTIILRPVIGASRAVGQTLMGVGNQVDRANVRRNEDKYKPR